MSTITKEWLQQTIAEYEANRDELPFGLDTNSAIELQAFKLALASLEAKPVAWRYRHHNGLAPSNWKVVDSEDECNVAPNYQRQALYTAPPAPVSVPDEREAFNTWNNDTDCPLAGRDAKTAAWLAWCRRAAMLQGADTELQRKAAIHDALCEKYGVESLSDFVEWQRNHIAELEAAPPAPVGEDETVVMPDYPGYVMTQRECFEAGKKAGMAELVTTAYKLPDGWVACSERMPTPNQYVLVCNGVWVGMGMHNNSEQFEDDERWQDEHHEFIDLLHHPVTHWMPLPAAPQQEVKP